MLVLTRLLNEAIMIGDEIEITVLEIRGDRVRIGIRAPQQVPIHRKEVYQAIREANLEAAKADAVTVNDLGELGRTLVRPPFPTPPEKSEKEFKSPGPPADNRA